MKKSASKRQKRQPSGPVVPPSPFDFEETVRRVLKVKPPAKQGTKKR
jgi:hypothetical protein